MSAPWTIRRIYDYPAYYVSLVIFTSVSLALNFCCALALPLRNRPHALARSTILRLFRSWSAWMHAARLVYVRFHGFTPEAMAGPAVYVANHPGILDAPFILSQLPDTICIFKPAIMRNPVLGPAARLAGYVAGDNGVDLIREVAAEVANNRSLLIFPEGTRTAPGRSLNPLRAGFALIAQRAGVPVRLISVHAPRDLIPKGWPWWRAPGFPAQVDVTLFAEIPPNADLSAKALTEVVTRQFSTALTSHESAVADPSGSHP